MLRRLKTDMLDGKRLIVLPERVVQVVSCDFDEDERMFYKALEEKIQVQVEKFMESGTVMNNYTAVLVLLLRLRQGTTACFWLLPPSIESILDLVACNHPALVTKDFGKDKDAIESTPAKEKDTNEDDDLADDLAARMANLGLVKEGPTCTVCGTRHGSSLFS
jgi:SNF2 family DNA or RNA helicase